MIQEERVLVVSAHAADYVWRSGGTIAKYRKAGAEVSVVVLSCGVRGESNDLWKQQDQTSEQVEEIRTGETTKAASILGKSLKGGYLLMVIFLNQTFNFI